VKRLLLLSRAVLGLADTVARSLTSLTQRKTQGVKEKAPGKKLPDGQSGARLVKPQLHVSTGAFSCMDV